MLLHAYCRRSASSQLQWECHCNNTNVCAMYMLHTDTTWRFVINSDEILLLRLYQTRQFTDKWISYTQQIQFQTSEDKSCGKKLIKLELEWTHLQNQQSFICRANKYLHRQHDLQTNLLHWQMRFTNPTPHNAKQKLILRQGKRLR
jgi:hypothetical protein